MASVAASTVRRWLAEDAVRPWRYRSWVFPRDPGFAARAGRVLDLYERIWESRPLEDDEYVISTDEKSQLQVLTRVHPGLPPGPGRGGRAGTSSSMSGVAPWPTWPPATCTAPPDGPGRADDRDRAVHRAGGPGDVRRAVRWPQLSSVQVRFRGQFAYITGQLPGGDTLPLCRLRYGGYASRWGFAIYRASHEDYQDSYLPAGYSAGTPEEALDCACGLYLGDPSAWQTDTATDTHTN